MFCTATIADSLIFQKNKHTIRMYVYPAPVITQNTSL